MVNVLRARVPAGVLVAAGVVLSAGCSSADTPPTPSPTTSTPTTSAPSTSAPSTSAPSTSAPTTTPDPPPPGPTASTSPPTPPTGGTALAPCGTGDLQVTVGGGSGGAAGSVYTAVLFVNTGPASCTLDGHPGVSFVGGDDGHQVGAAAARGDADPLTRVVLASGQQAHATLRIVQAGVYGDSRCRAEPVRGLRVYPPDQTAAAFVPFATPGGTACSAQSAPQLTVDTVQPGPPTR